MNNIVFNKIRIQNFLSISDPVEFDFDCHSGLNYVFGENKDIEGVRNGAGKTLIFCDAILFVLFGQTSKKVTAKYLANRQSIAKYNTEVCLWFTIGTDKYVIKAGLLHPHCAGASFFKIWKNNNEISKATLKDTRNYFEKNILKTNYNVFKNSVILSSSNSHNFFNLTKSMKKEFIEDIFNLSVFGKMLKKIRIDQNNIDKEILALQNSNKQLYESIEDFKKQNAQFNLTQKKSIEKIKTKIDEKNAHIIRLESENTKLNIDKNIMTEFNLSELYDNRQKLNDAKSKAETIIKQYSQKIKFNNDTINKHKDILKEICKNCLIKISNKFNINQAQTDIKDGLNKINQYKDIIPKLEIQLKDIIDKIKSAEDNNEKIKSLDKSIQHNILVIDHLKNDIIELNKKIEEESKKVSPFNNLIIEYAQKYKDNTALLENFYKEKKYLDLLNHISDEDGAKKFIIKDLISVLNAKTRKYLIEIGSSYTCIFDECFNCDFITETGPCSYENFSKGERSRINIAVLFAFKDILINLKSISTNILVLDEFLDEGLDQFAINSIIKILKKISIESNKIIFLISHRECLNEEDFDGVIEIQKNGGLTTIVADSQNNNKNN